MAGLIRQIIFDYDGVFTNDDYTTVLTALNKSSGLEVGEINNRCGELERLYVLSPDSKEFLGRMKKEFKFPGTTDDLAALLNERGDSGLFAAFPRFLSWKNDGDGRRGLSILSNQIAYRVPYVRGELDFRIGLEHFDRVWFSPEVGLQKPFVGFTQDTSSTMDIEGVNIFPFAINQMLHLDYLYNECVFIDDSAKNVESARRAGLNGILFKGVEQMLTELEEGYQVRV